MDPLPESFRPDPERLGPPEWACPECGVSQVGFGKGLHIMGCMIEYMSAIHFGSMILSRENESIDWVKLMEKELSQNDEDPA